MTRPLPGSALPALACLFAVVVVIGWPNSALADWTVIPYGQGPSREAQRASEFLVRALHDRQVPVVSLHETRDRFRSHAPWPGEPLPSDREALHALAEKALQEAAYGRREGARRAAEDALRLAEANIEALNRDTAAARDILDACLAIVRVDLQEKDRQRAVTDAKRCRQLVPDLLPRETSHSAEVIGALAEAENQLRRSGSEALVVEVEGQKDCAIFLNGRRLGSAPFRWERGAPGRSRIEIECGPQRSRVHIVTLGKRAVTLRIAPDRDVRVQDEGVLALRYSSPVDQEELLVTDAVAIASLVDAKQIVLVGESSDAVVLVRYDVLRARAVASTSVGLDVLRGDDFEPWRRAADALAREQMEVPPPAAFLGRDVASRVAGAPLAAVATPSAAPAPPALPSVVPESAAPQSSAAIPPATAAQPEFLAASASAPSSHSRRPGVLVAGGVLSGLGVALVATGFGLYARSQDLKDDAESIPLEMLEEQQAAQEEYDDFRRLPLIGVGGAGLLATGVPMLLPPRGPASKLAWAGGVLAGLAGAGLVGVGAWKLSEQGGGVLGGLLVSCAAPLIEIPITQLVRAARE